MRLSLTFSRTFASVTLMALTMLGARTGFAVSDPDVEKSAPAAAPTVIIETTQGNITLELYPEKAPQTVQNFLRYVDSGQYDGTIFHRVIQGFMIQGGGFTADFSRKQTGEPIQNEANNGLKNTRGTIAMARTMDPHSATAQFFINTRDNVSLDHRAENTRGFGYCVFGKVTEGMDVVDRIEGTPTGAAGPFRSDVPKDTIKITSIKRK